MRLEYKLATIVLMCTSFIEVVSVHSDNRVQPRELDDGWHGSNRARPSRRTRQRSFGVLLQTRSVTLPQPKDSCAASGL